MSKKILITSTDLMMIQFLIPHVKNLTQNGFEVDIACSDVGGRINDIEEQLAGYVNKIHIVRLKRSPLSPTNLKGYRDMKRIINHKKYDIIWTNEPVMGVVTRVAAKKSRKSGTKVLYMAHGFHFYKGSPKKNWLIFYTAEKLCSYVTDTLVTINKEDYNLAKKKMKAKSIVYMPGIGINLNKFTNEYSDDEMREQLSCNKNQIILVSVGELSERKNHEVIIKALGQIKKEFENSNKNFNIKYFIVGKGPLESYLRELISENCLNGKVELLGYRNDIDRILRASDIFVFSSLQEGLPVALMEAMASGLPVIASKIRGNTDLIDKGKGGFLVHPRDIDGFAASISKVLDKPECLNKMKDYNLQKIKEFSEEVVLAKMKDLLSNL